MPRSPIAYRRSPQARSPLTPAPPCLGWWPKSPPAATGAESSRFEGLRDLLSTAVLVLLAPATIPPTVSRPQRLDLGDYMRTLIRDSKDRLGDTRYLQRETDNWLFFASILLLLWGLSSPLEGKNGSFAITAWRRWLRGSSTAAGGRATAPSTSCHRRRGPSHNSPQSVLRGGTLTALAWRSIIDTRKTPVGLTGS